MSYAIEVLQEERIMVETWGADFNPEVEAEETIQKELEILSAATGPMVAIVDMRQVQLDWNDILYLASHGVPDELKNHPNLHRIILLTTDEVVEKSAEGMNSEAFGFIKLDIVASKDEALARARHLLQ